MQMEQTRVAGPRRPIHLLRPWGANPNHIQQQDCKPKHRHDVAGGLDLHLLAVEPKLGGRYRIRLQVVVSVVERQLGAIAE